MKNTPMYTVTSANSDTASRYGNHPLGLSQPLSKFIDYVVPKDRKAVYDLPPRTSVRVRMSFAAKDPEAVMTVQAH